MMKSKYEALDIAKYIIAYSAKQGYTITNLRLQKLLYFIYKKYLQMTDHNLFDDYIYAWEFGPTVSNIYFYFSNHAGIPLRNEYRIDELNIDKDTKQLINNIISQYKDMPIDRLIQISMKSHGAWDITFQKDEGSRIEPALIKKEE